MSTKILEQENDHLRTCISQLEKEIAELKSKQSSGVRLDARLAAANSALKIPNTIPDEIKCYIGEKSPPRVRMTINH